MRNWRLAATMNDYFSSLEIRLVTWNNINLDNWFFVSEEFVVEHKAWCLEYVLLGSELHVFEFLKSKQSNISLEGYADKPLKILLYSILKGPAKLENFC